MNKKFMALFLVLVFLVLNLQACSNTDKDKAGTESDGNETIGDNMGGDGAKADDKAGSKADDASSAEDNPTPLMGRYMEKKVELPELAPNEGIIGVLQNSEKQFEVYTSLKKQVSCYRQNEDMTWESSTPAWLNNWDITSEYQITNLLSGADDNLYVSFESYSDNDVKSFILKSTDGGKTAQKIDLPYLNETTDTSEGYTLRPRIQRLGVMKNGTLVFNELGNPELLMLYSQEGEKLGEIRSQELFNFLVTGNSVITSDEDGTAIQFFDGVNCKVEKTVDYASKNMTSVCVLKGDGTLLVGDSKGIHRLVKDGTLWETTVDGVLNSMSMPSLTLLSLFVMEGAQEEYFAVYLNGDGAYSFKHYVFDKNVSSVPSREITVYSLKENNTVRQAISLFQASSDDIKINYVVAMGEEAGNISDYIRALNTELLAGNGADILILDGLPANSYIEKGVLEDISDIINPLVKTGQLAANIAGSYQENGKTYRMPTRLTLPIIMGKADAVNSLDTLNHVITYIEQSGTPYISFKACREMLEDFYALYSKDLLQNGKLTEDRLKAFLENMKKLADNITQNNKSEDWSSDADNGNSFGEELFRGDIISLAENYSVALTNIDSIYDAIFPLAVAKAEKSEICSMNKYFVPGGIIGLNHASKEIETAKEFISYLLSEDVQSTNLYDGFPVNKVSLEQWFAKEDANYYISMSVPGGKKYNGGWPTKEEREALRDIALSCDMPIELDHTLSQMILDGALPYLLGNIDINQAVSDIMNKVNLYMAE